MPQPWTIAVPSCVIPGTVAENARFLAGKVAEVGLCLFEAESCLRYGVTDIPTSLAQLPLTWHIHLPVDLPWEAGGAAAAVMALAVGGKVRFLQPRLAVLHPPAGSPETQARLLRDFAAAWRKHSACPLLLENIDTCPLATLPADIFDAFAVCLDVGHMLGFGQEVLLEQPHILHKVRLVHWSAPGAKDQHLPLRALTADQRGTACRVLRQIPREACHMLEIFHWAGVDSSRPVLTTLQENAWL